MIFKNNINEESKLLIQEYAKNPINNYKMENPTITQHEGNFICGDDINIYLKIENNIITDFSFDGNCSTITIASSSFLSELIINKNIKTILTRNHKTIQEQGFIVSNRRKRSAVIGLVAVQNAIYKYLNIKKTVDLEDLIED